jgi:glycosyltransferase involved in cell wall biosynthesis
MKAALEAMSYKVPCILTEACNLNDFIEAEAALLCGIKSDEIANSLEKALKSTDLEVENIKLKMDTILNNNYSWIKIAEDMINYTN